MRASFPILIAATGAILSVSSASAQTAVSPENVRPQDVVTSPLSDMNIKKRDIPPVLQAAVDRPYDLSGIKSCAGFTTAVADLDMVLGEDIDVAQDQSDEEKMGNTAGAVAKSVIGSFIPFRGVIRELSGANAQERAWQRAVYAGSVRRAFLKGMGQQRGCAYPARAATPQVLASLDAQREAARLARKKDKSDDDEKTAGVAVPASAPAAAPTDSIAPSYESVPVVQQVPEKR
ncbi:MAG: hypothetical protein ABW203_08305 [Novosphingobium sp.]